MQLNWGNFWDTWKDSWKTLGISGEIWGYPKQTWGDLGRPGSWKKPDTYYHFCLTQDSSLSSHYIQTTDAMGLVRLGRFWGDLTRL